MSLKRGSIALAMLGAAFAPLLITGNAVAAPATTYINELAFRYGDSGNTSEVYHNNCLQGQAVWNQQYYGNVNGTSDQYFYCARGAGNSWNLWWRHAV